jgi:erythromycin esterase-like protein
VLLGEASHGTHEFYAERARITQRLIEEKGFCAVAVEADWPDAYRVNRFVRGRSDDVTAEEALRGFERFPTWMWRNTVVLDFVGWLRERNQRAGMGERAKVGFYGLDLYGLYRSIPLPQSVRVRGSPVSTTTARRARPTAMRRRSARGSPANVRCSTSSSTSMPTGWSTRGATGWWPRRSSSMRSRARAR